MKKLISLLSLLFPLAVQASGLQSSFTSSNLSGLTRSTTMVEYDGTVSPANVLQDRSGRGHHLSPTSDPPSAASSLQRSDGTRYIARSFDGAADYYNVAHHADFNVFDTDFTLTFVLAGSSAGADIDGFFRHSDGTNGLNARVNASGYVTADFYPAVVATVTGPSLSIRDDKYHVVQLVRSNDYAFIAVDGSYGSLTSVAGKGIDVSTILYLGTAGGTVFQGSILYVRLDAEALSLDRLNYERNQIMGIGPRSGTADISWDFSRASTAFSTYSDTSMNLVTNNVPRSGGDGGGFIVEGSATNLLGAASQRNVSSGWAATYLTPTLNTHTAPDNTQTYDQLLETADNDVHKISQNYTLANGTTYTMSAVLQPAGRNYGGFGAAGDRTWSAITPGGISNGLWWGVAASGNTLLACDYSHRTYLSTDNGANWSAVTFPGPVTTGQWYGGAVSGNTLLAVNYGGRTYLSTDNGANWSAVTFPSGVTTGNWRTAAASGNTLLVGNTGGRFYISTDNGANWSAVTFPGGVTNGSWQASGASGNTLLALNAYQRAYLSTDNGSNWSAITFPGGVTTGSWGGAVSGSTLLVTAYGGRAYISTDNGSNWSAITFPGGVTTGNWWGGAVSGSTLLVLNQGGLAYISTDNGSNWSAITFPGGVTTGSWMSAAASGNTLLVGNNEGGLYLSTSGLITSSVLWNLTNGINTKQDAAWTTAGSQRLNNGNLRVWSTITGSGSAVPLQIIPSSDGTTVSYAGDVTKGIAVGDMVLETGKFPTSIPDPATGTRSADYASVRPYKIGKGMQLGGEKMWIDFSQDPTGATIVTNAGGYTLTKGGTVVRRNEYAKGESYHVFNGTDSKYSVASADFNPAGNFSVVAVFTPSSVTGNHIIASKYLSTGDQRGWYVMQTDDDIAIARTTDGTAGTLLAATVNNCLAINKPVLVTANYSTTGGLWIKVDAFTAVTQAATGTVHPSTYDFVIGDHGTGAKFAGNMHYVAFYDHGVGGTVLTEAQHDALYAKFKQANILPRKIGTSYIDKKLYIEFDAKCPYTGAETLSATYTLLDIGGNIGKSDANTNRLSIYHIGDYTWAGLWPDNENTNRFMTTETVNLDQWHHYKFYWDFADLSNSTGYVDTTLFTNNATLDDAKDLDFSDTLIRLGQDYTGTPNNFCTTKNLRIWSAP